MKKKQIKVKKEKKKNSIADILMGLPLIIWTVVVIILPMIFLLFISFMKKGIIGGIVYQPTLENYKSMLDPLYLSVIKNSLVVAVATTAVEIVLGYFIAMLIATRKKEQRSILLLMVMIPYWVNILIIISSFVSLFNTSGIINNFLVGIGILKQPAELLYNNFSVVIGMVYVFLPIAIMPMYSSIEKMDWNLVEASRDLGAGALTTFFRITLPLTRSGIMASIVLVFIPSIGYYMITDMLGGGTSMLIGNLIYNQFSVARNWPFGAALSAVLAIVILIMFMIFNRFGSKDDMVVM